MATFTVRPEGIIRQPALTMPGNATGAEAACTSLTASQIRTLLSLGTTSDVTFDIVRATTSVQTPLVNNASAALTLGNSTYGVTVPGALAGVSAAFNGAAATSGGVTVSNYLYSSYIATGNGGGAGSFVARALTGAADREAVFATYRDGGTFFGVSRFDKSVLADNSAASGGLLIGSVSGSTQIASNNVVRLTLDTAGAATFSGDISMQKATQGYIRAYETAGVKNAALYHDGTDAILSASSGLMRITSAASNVFIYGSSGALLTYGNGVDVYTGVSGSQFGRLQAGNIRAFGSGTSQYTNTSHTGTNGEISTSSGNLNLVPTGGTVAVTGGITASGGATITGGGVTGTYGIKLGSLDNASTGAVWVSSVTPSSSNFMIAGDTNYTAINTPNGTLYFKIAGVEAATISKVAGVSHYEMTVDAFRSTAYAIFNYSDYNGGGTLNWSAACMNAVNTQYRTLFNKSDLGTIVTASTGIYGWNGSADITFSGTNDTGLARDAAGVVEINHGTLVSGGGSYGGLKCAGITASGNVSYAQGLSTGTVTKSANYTTTADDYCVNVTANSIDITFETAVGCANREHEVINSGSGVVTLKTTSAQTISGSASGALTLAQWKSIRVKSDGANWLIMSQIT